MKTTSLPSVKDRVKTICSCRKGSMDAKQYEATVEYNLTQDRNQAYTRLVKGIEGMMKEFVPAKNIQIGGMESDVWKLVPKEDGMYCLNCERFIHEEGCTCGMASLTDILENVVKPLYGKK